MQHDTATPAGVPAWAINWRGIAIRSFTIEWRTDSDTRVWAHLAAMRCVRQARTIILLYSVGAHASLGLGSGAARLRTPCRRTYPVQEHSVNSNELLELPALQTNCAT